MDEPPRRLAAPESIRRGAVRITRWFELPPEAQAAVDEWLRDGRLVRGEAFKAGRVHRCGEAVLKRFDRGDEHRLRALFPGDAALREARRAHAIRPVRAPEPWAALRSPQGGLLVSEYVAGATLRTAWVESEASRAALPEFLARMHSNGVLHGDPHGENMLWTGDEWLLLDLGGLRRGLHCLVLRGQLVRRHWARLVHDVLYVDPNAESQLRALFGNYLERVAPRRDIARDAEAAWSTVRRGAAEYTARWVAQAARR